MRPKSQFSLVYGLVFGAVTAWICLTTIMTMKAWTAPGGVWCGNTVLDPMARMLNWGLPLGVLLVAGGIVSAARSRCSWSVIVPLALLFVLGSALAWEWWSILASSFGEPSISKSLLWWSL